MNSFTSWIEDSYLTVVLYRGADISYFELDENFKCLAVTLANKNLIFVHCLLRRNWWYLLTVLLYKRFYTSHFELDENGLSVKKKNSRAV